MKVEEDTIRSQSGLVYYVYKHSFEPVSFLNPLGPDSKRSATNLFMDMVKSMQKDNYKFGTKGYDYQSDVYDAKSYSKYLLKCFLYSLYEIIRFPVNIILVFTAIIFSLTVSPLIILFNGYRDRYVPWYGEFLGNLFFLAILIPNLMLNIGRVITFPLALPLCLAMKKIFAKKIQVQIGEESPVSTLIQKINSGESLSNQTLTFPQIRRLYHCPIFRENEKIYYEVLNCLSEESKFYLKYVEKFSKYRNKSNYNYIDFSFKEADYTENIGELFSIIDAKQIELNKTLSDYITEKGIYEFKEELFKSSNVNLLNKKLISAVIEHASTVRNYLISTDNELGDVGKFFYTMLSIAGNLDLDANKTSYKFSQQMFDILLNQYASSQIGERFNVNETGLKKFLEGYFQSEYKSEILKGLKELICDAHKSQYNNGNYFWMEGGFGAIASKSLIVGLLEQNISWVDNVNLYNCIDSKSLEDLKKYFEELSIESNVVAQRFYYTMLCCMNKEMCEHAKVELLELDNLDKIVDALHFKAIPYSDSFFHLDLEKAIATLQNIINIYLKKYGMNMPSERSAKLKSVLSNANLPWDKLLNPDFILKSGNDNNLKFEKLLWLAFKFKYNTNDQGLHSHIKSIFHKMNDEEFNKFTSFVEKVEDQEILNNLQLFIKKEVRSTERYSINPVIGHELCQLAEALNSSELYNEMYSNQVFFEKLITDYPSWLELFDKNFEHIEINQDAASTYRARRLKFWQPEILYKYIIDTLQSGDQEDCNRLIKSPFINKYLEECKSFIGGFQNDLLLNFITGSVDSNLKEFVLRHHILIATVLGSAISDDDFILKSNSEPSSISNDKNINKAIYETFLPVLYEKLTSYINTGQASDSVDSLPGYITTSLAIVLKYGDAMQINAILAHPPFREILLNYEFVFMTMLRWNEIDDLDEVLKDINFNTIEEFHEEFSDLAEHKPICHQIISSTITSSISDNTKSYIYDGYPDKFYDEMNKYLLSNTIFDIVGDEELFDPFISEKVCASPYALISLLSNETLIYNLILDEQAEISIKFANIVHNFVKDIQNGKYQYISNENPKIFRNVYRHLLTFSYKFKADDIRDLILQQIDDSFNLVITDAEDATELLDIFAGSHNNIGINNKPYPEAIEYVLSNSLIAFKLALTRGAWLEEEVEKIRNEYCDKINARLYSPDGTPSNYQFNDDTSEYAAVMILEFIKQNKPYDEYKFLFDIPGIEKKIAFDDNAIFKYVLHNNKGQLLARRLLRFDDVLTMARANNFYRNEGERVDMRAIADVESSMRSLNPKQQQQYNAMLDRYYDTMNDKGGADIILGECRAELQRRYNENPAVLKLIDAEIILPFDYNEMEKLFDDKKLTEAQKEAALVQYYKHPEHSAHRFISIPNRWMEPGAPYQSQTLDGYWYSPFTELSEFIAIHWLAASDENEPESAGNKNDPESGYDTDKRVQYFTEQIRMITRAHNYDDSLINARAYKLINGIATKNKNILDYYAIDDPLLVTQFDIGSCKFTALELACALGHKDIVKKLLSNKYVVKKLEKTDGAAYFFALAQGKELAELFEGRVNLTEYPADHNQQRDNKLIDSLPDDNQQRYDKLKNSLDTICSKSYKIANLDEENYGADRPSCFPGMKSRIANSIIEHSVIPSSNNNNQPLTEDEVKMELMSFIFEFYKEHFSSLSYEQLEAVVKNIEDVIDEEEDINKKLIPNIPISLIDSFKAGIEIMGINVDGVSFEDYFKELFDLSKSYDSHFMKFAGEIELMKHLNKLMAEKKPAKKAERSEKPEARKSFTPLKDGIASRGGSTDNSTIPAAADPNRPAKS